MDSEHAVLRFRDGRTERVHISAIDFEHHRVIAKSAEGASASVAFEELKAVFFPKSQGQVEPASGHTVTVEFADGEVIRGIATYNPERNGFFLYPEDRSKNDRIFVVNSAIVSIEVEKL